MGAELMARIRSVKPEFFRDEDLAVEVPNRDARLLYIGLWGIADEEGRLRDSTATIKGEVFPYDPDLTPEVIDKLIDMLAETGRVVRYRSRNSVYLYLPKLSKHQRLEPHKTPSRLPQPPIELEQQQSQTFPDNPGKNPEKSAPKQAASSKEQVAGPQSAEIPAPSAAPPTATQPAARLIIDASGVTPELAIAAATLIARERKHRNLPGLVQRIIDAGELSEWLRKAEAALRKPAARASPCAKHAKRNCRECRSEQLGGVDV